ncbi:hypothetical protein AAZX31_18G119800 [Glycine max]
MNKRSLSHRTHTTSSLSLSAHHHKLSLSLSLSVASRATTPSLWLFFFSLYWMLIIQVPRPFTLDDE